jgi:hypothetical protein
VNTRAVLNDLTTPQQICRGATPDLQGGHSRFAGGLRQICSSNRHYSDNQNNNNTRGP